MMTQPKDNRAVTSPFLTIPLGWRATIITYFLVYQIFFPAVAGIFDPAAEGFLVARIILHSIRVLLTIFPLLMYRKEYGFLHPIILPVLIATFESITKYPLSILNPIAMPVFDYAVATNSKAASLVMPYMDLAATRVWHELLQIFGLVCYYLGYFVLNVFKVPKIRLEAPGGRLSVICAIGITLCVLTGLVFIQLQGGLVTHLLAMRGGRAALFAGQGQFLVISEFSVVIALVWFLYLNRPFQNPLWLACMAAASFTTLVIGGSRSSLILALVTLVLLWWRRRNKVLLVPTVTMAVISVLIISIFGSIRQDWGSKTINTSVFSISAVGENFDRASREFEHRDDEEGDLAAFAGAKDGLLWGRSYLAAVSFVVPRAIWPDKPHGAGAYNMWVNFARQQMDDFGSKTYWGIPLGAVTEAYWNFWLPGVVVFIGLFGAFNRWLSDLVIAYPQKPVVLLFSVWMSTHFVGDPNSFINSVRSALLLIALSMVLGIIRLNKARGPRRGVSVGQGVGAGLPSS